MDSTSQGTRTRTAPACPSLSFVVADARQKDAEPLVCNRPDGALGFCGHRTKFDDRGIVFAFHDILLVHMPRNAAGKNVRQRAGYRNFIRRWPSEYNLRTGQCPR
jgi:hypothetical protein